MAGLDDVFGKLAEFSGGVTSSAPVDIIADTTISQGNATVQVPTLNGEMIGEVAGVSFWVPITRLELAPREDLLNCFYDPNNDPGFVEYCLAVKAHGDKLPIFPVRPAGRNRQDADGVMRPVYLIYDMPELYYAIIKNGTPRARVELSEGKLGSDMLAAVGREGQLRRPPSMMELSMASYRLNTTYGFTYDEIAEQQARNSEDNSKPSKTQIHYQCAVAQLPEEIRLMVHHGSVLWTHARVIATTFQGDERTCLQMASLASQGKRMRVEDLENAARRVRDGLSRLIENDGVVREEKFGTSNLASDRLAKRVTPTVLYTTTMIAKPAQIQRAASKYTEEIEIVPDDEPGKVSVTRASLEPLQEWLEALRSRTIPLKDVETTLLAYLHAARIAATDAGVVNAKGEIAAVIEDIERQAQ
jgi:hypothetical protein